MTPDALARLHATCFVVPRPWRATEFAGLLSQDTVFLETQGETGFILGRAIVDEAELLTLAVAPEARRCGVARALVAAFEGEATRRGARRSFLEVAQTNTPAIALYESAGYIRIAMRPNYYTPQTGASVSALIMEKAWTQV